MIALAAPASKLWKSYRLYGPAETVCRLLHRTQLASVKHSFDVYFKDLSGTPDAAGPGISGRAVCGGREVAFREIGAAELEQLRFAPGLQYAADRSIVGDVRKQFSKGLRFFAAFDAGTVVALNGAHLSAAHLDYIHKPAIPLPAGVAYLNGAFTVPAYRRRRIGSALREYMLSVLRAEGFQRVVLTTFSEELGVVRWHLANDFLLWGRVTYLRRGAREFWWTRLSTLGRRHRSLLNLGSDPCLTPCSSR
jgi:GNAT superfamily N-acetyltransferase